MLHALSYLLIITSGEGQAPEDITNEPAKSQLDPFLLTCWENKICPRNYLTLFGLGAP